MADRAVVLGRARQPRSIRPQDRWGTPRGLFHMLSEEFGGFTVDVAADAANALCDRFYGEDDNGLSQSWMSERAWMNPPYSNIEPWTKKAAAEARDALIVGLLPVRTDLMWFHRDVLATGAEIRFIQGRLQYVGGTNPERGQNAPFPSMIVVWGTR